MKKIYEKKGQRWNNEYFDADDHVVLKISRIGTEEEYEVLIDHCDLEKVQIGQWFISKNNRNKVGWKDTLGVVWTKTIGGKQHNFQVYQWILDTKFKGVLVDHINGNRLDNRRSNLRIATNKENSFNQKHKGYNYDKPTGKYLTRIKAHNNKLTNIGRYKTELEAETMYLKAYILLGYFSHYHEERIKELGITLTEEDMNNKYIQKLLKIKEEYFG